MPRVLAAILAELVAVAILVGSPSSWSRRCSPGCCAWSSGSPPPPRSRPAWPASRRSWARCRTRWAGSCSPSPPRPQPTSSATLNDVRGGRRRVRHQPDPGHLRHRHLRAGAAGDPGLDPDDRRRRAVDQAAGRDRSSPRPSAATWTPCSGSWTAPWAPSCGSASCSAIVTGVPHLGRPHDREQLGIASFPYAVTAAVLLGALQLIPELGFFLGFFPIALVLVIGGPVPAASAAVVYIVGDAGSRRASWRRASRGASWTCTPGS